jgi:hypothetical protein
MALITITLQDSPTGPQMGVLSEPPMPRTVLDGRPTPAQNAAACMLNALEAAMRADRGPAILVPGH